MRNIKTQQWLIDNIDNDNLVILDARAHLNDSSYGYESYKESHIPGALFVSLKETMSGPVKEHGGRHPLPNMEKFNEDMRLLGIRDSSNIVVYDDGTLEMASRLWWLLKYSGRENVFILEGGFSEWTKSNCKTTNKNVTPIPSNSLSLNIKDGMLVIMEEVREAVTSDNTAIIDSRAYERYIGEVEPLDSRAGHIPSALNYPWTQLNSSMSIEEHYKDLKDYDDIIVYCGPGITGSVNYLFMEEAGLKPKLYSGSYSDWVSYDDNPVNKKDPDGPCSDY